MPRVNKLDVPLLVVGLGGTGADGLLRVKSLFRQRLNPEIIGDKEQDHPPRTAFLEIDTDDCVLRKSCQGVEIDPETEWFSLKCDMGYILSDASGARVPAYCRDWLSPDFYTDPMLRTAAIMDSAYRQIARLALFCHADGLYTRLVATLHRLAACAPGASPSRWRVNVVVITGLSGAAGSGVFLDFAYLLRHAAEQQNISFSLELYVLMPDIFVSKLDFGDPRKLYLFEARGVTALKELDDLMGSDGCREGGEVPTVQYSDSLILPWKGRPYDDVALLCGTNMEGVLLQDAYDTALDAVAQTLLFTMADEVGWTAADKEESGCCCTPNVDWTFQAASAYEQAYRQIGRTVPPQCHYRSIGVCSTLEEKPAKLTLETGMLLEGLGEFCRQPDRMPVMEGKDPEEFVEPFRARISGLYDAFIAQTPYPEAVVSGLPPFDMQSLRRLDPEQAPHRTLLPGWIRETIYQQPRWMETIQADLLDLFRRTAADFIRSRGPQALEVMLSDPDHGFLRWLRDRADQYRDVARTTRNACGTAMEDASSCFTDFRCQGGIQGLLHQPRLFQSYLTLLKNAFESHRDQLFFAAAEEAIRAVQTGIAKRVLERSLPGTIQALEELKKEYSLLSAHTPQNTFIPGGMERIRQEISGMYADARTREQLQSDALAQVAEVALAGDLNPEQAEEALRHGLAAVLDRAFYPINDAPLRDVLAGAAGGDIRTYAATNLAPHLEAGAEALFALSPARLPDIRSSAVFVSFVSVPHNMPEVKTGIRHHIITRGNAYSCVVFKNSLAEDQVFWLNVTAGLPLSAYRFLEEYAPICERYRDLPGLHLMPTAPGKPE